MPEIIDNKGRVYAVRTLKVRYFPKMKFKQVIYANSNELCFREKHTRVAYTIRMRRIISKYEFKFKNRDLLVAMLEKYKPVVQISWEEKSTLKGWDRVEVRNGMYKFYKKDKVYVADTPSYLLAAVLLLASPEDRLSLLTS